MRSRTKIALGSLAAGLLVAAGVVGTSAAGGWGRHGHAGGPMLMMESALTLFETADGDKDGKLSQAELSAFVASQRQGHDGDGDGEISLEEFGGVWNELTRPMRVRAFQFVDADGNARLSEAELQRPLDRLLARLDRNDDGSIARDELRRRGRHGERGSDQRP